MSQVIREGRGTTERELREAIRELARIYRWRFFFVHTSRFSPRGFPDLVLCRPPRLIFAELKRELGPKGGGPQPSADQQAWLWDLSAVGRQVEVYLWRPADLERIAAILGPEPLASFARALDPLAK